MRFFRNSNLMQTDWKPKSCQPAVEIAQDHIDVRHTQREPDRLIAVLGDPGKLRQEQRLQVLWS